MLNGQSSVSLALVLIYFALISLCSNRGASNITVVDIDENRVNFALKEGFATAGHTLPRLPRPESMQAGIDASKDAAAKIVSTDLPGQDGYDLVYECTGVQSCIQMSAFVSLPADPFRPN